MESVSSEDEFDEMSERFESYSLSADVSESESSSSDFSGRHLDDNEGASTSLTSLASSSLVETEYANYTGTSAPVPIMLRVVSSRHVAIPVTKMQKPDTDLSGELSFFELRAFVMYFSALDLFLSLSLLL